MRYGVPSPRRTAGGQRMYDPEIVPFLNLVQRVLACGLRPAQALTMSVAELRSVLHRSSHPADWMRAAVALEPERLRSYLIRDFAALGAFAFVTDRAVPFLHALGDAWEAGEIGVHHEHLATAMLASFVGERWREIASSLSGDPVMLVTLPGEMHTLGIELAALVAACAGHPVRLLGGVPPDAVSSAIRSLQPRWLLLSVSRTRAEGDLGALDELLAVARASGVRILAGGGGMPEREGVENLRDLGTLAGRLGAP
jgi:hypothetical protein